MRCDEEMIEVAVKHFGHEFLMEAGEGTEGACTVSDSFDKRMHALIARKAARRTGRQTMKILSRVAAVLFVVVVVFSVAVLSSTALRSRFINLLYEVGGDRAQISFTGADIEELPAGVVIPDYLPCGYELVNTDAKGTSITSVYENEAGNTLIIHQSPLEIQINVMQDGGSQTQVAGRTVYFVENEGSNTVIFNNDWYSFMIYGGVDVSEMLIIADSMLD